MTKIFSLLQLVEHQCVLLVSAIVDCGLQTEQHVVNAVLIPVCAKKYDDISIVLAAA